MNINPIRSNKNQLLLSPRVSGLGGWLILVQLGLFATIIIQVLNIFQNIIPIFTTETWNVLTSKSSINYDAFWGPTIIFEAIFNFVFLVFSLYCLVNMYQKKSILPTLMITFYSSNLFFVIVDYILIKQIHFADEFQYQGISNDIIRAAIACIIWIPYFIKSERVRNTFVK